MYSSLLDLCVSSLRRGHANLLCIVPILTDDPRGESDGSTPGLHNKIPAHKIFARVWVAQEPIFYTINAKILQGLGPKRRESCDGDWVHPTLEHRCTGQRGFKKSRAQVTWTLPLCISPHERQTRNSANIWVALLV